MDVQIDMMKMVKFVDKAKKGRATPEQINYVNSCRAKLHANFQAFLSSSSAVR